MIIDKIKGIITAVNMAVTMIKSTMISSSGKKKYEKAANFLNIAIVAIGKVCDYAPKIKDSYRYQVCIQCIKDARDFFADLRNRLNDVVDYLNDKLDKMGEL